jgi:hypothetical protein
MGMRHEITSKPESRIRKIGSTLKVIVSVAMERHNAKAAVAPPGMILRPYTFNDTLQIMDEHRLAALGQIDMLLERNEINPEEAEAKKRNWDISHGYR